MICRPGLPGLDESSWRKPEPRLSTPGEETAFVQYRRGSFRQGGGEPVPRSGGVSPFVAARAGLVGFAIPAATESNERLKYYLLRLDGEG